LWFQKRRRVTVHSASASLLVVTKSREDVFDGLFFQSLSADLRSCIRLLEFGNDALTPALADAAAVIVMRHGLFAFGHLASAAGWSGVPRYYFLDDNLMLLSGEPEVYGPYWSAYTDDNVRRALRGFAGVLLASPRLTRYFEERAMHPHLIEYPPIAGPILRSRGRGAGGWQRATHEPFRLAFFGGEYRRDVFAACVYPAIQRLAADQNVELVLAGIDPAALPAPAAALRVVALPYERCYDAALSALARHRVDVLVHPTPVSRNNEYKNANVLINARAIGAVAVLSNLPPYDTLGAPPPAVLCDNAGDAWHAALARLAREPARCEEVFDNASHYCAEHFSGRPNAEAIRTILASHAPPGYASRAARRVIAGPALGVDRAVFRAKAIARRLLRPGLRPA
jgi:hypothetical protein